MTVQNFLMKWGNGNYHKQDHEFKNPENKPFENSRGKGQNAGKVLLCVEGHVVCCNELHTSNMFSIMMGKTLTFLSYSIDG